MADELEFVDTNVHVYAADLEAGVKRTQALALIMRLWTEQAGATSLQVMHELRTCSPARCVARCPRRMQ